MPIAEAVASVIDGQRTPEETRRPAHVAHPQARADLTRCELIGR
jgi:hypothetical protein